MTDKVATADEALAKMADVIAAAGDEAAQRNLMFKANDLIVQARNILALPEGARAEVAAEWLAKEDSLTALRKNVAEAVGITPEAEASVAEEVAAEADAGDGEGGGDEIDLENLTEDEIDALIDAMSDEELAALAAEIEAEEDELPPEFYDAIADASDEELELIGRYMAEAEKLDAAAEDRMAKAEALADVWLDRGDEDLKKFIGAAMGAMRSAGAFSRAVASRAAGSRAGQWAGRTFGVGAAGRGARDAAYMNVMRARTNTMRGLSNRQRTIGMTGRSTTLAQGAADRVAAAQRRNRMIAGGAIGTGVLGAGGALAAGRRKD